MRLLAALLYSSCALLALAPSASRAAETATESRLRDALRSTTDKLRALEDEQARAQARESQAKKELEALRKELLAARRAAPRQQKLPEARPGQEQLAAQAEASKKLGDSLAQCQKQLAEAAESARQKQGEEAALSGQLDGLQARSAGCEARAGRLYRLGNDFLAWLAADSSALCEPLIGLKRVALENKAQEFQDRLLELKPEVKR